MFNPRMFNRKPLAVTKSSGEQIVKTRQFAKCRLHIHDTVDDECYSDDDSMIEGYCSCEDCRRTREEARKSVDGKAVNCGYQGYRRSEKIGGYESSKLYWLDQKTTDAWSHLIKQCEMSDIKELGKGYWTDIHNGDGDGNEKNWRNKNQETKVLEEDKKCSSALKMFGLSVLDILTILWVSMLILIGHFGSVTLWALLDGEHPEYLSPILDSVLPNLGVALEETTSFLRSCYDYVTINNTHYIHIKTFKLA